MSQHSSYIISGYTIINQGTEHDLNRLRHFEALISELSSRDISPEILTIDPLSVPWQSDEQANHFRSGCAPIMALERATKLIAQGALAVVIQGDEPLASGYTKEERHQLMSVYPEQPPISQLYDQLSHQFMKKNHGDEHQFKALAQALFNNHEIVYQQLKQDGKAHFEMPSLKWLNHVTPLFRGVDCANPLIDFRGKLLICNEQLAQQLNPNKKIKVAGVALGIIDTPNEPDAIELISQYTHLTRAFTQANQQAQINFVDEFKRHNALLEVYTCYPVVPMAFLLRNGFISQLDQLNELLEDYPVTITGGMNLSRAPWNNPSLNALIAMYDKLLAGQQEYGLVHGNGGLGYRQGVAILTNK